MGESALPRWLDWARRLHDWCPLWPTHRALLRIDGLILPNADLVDADLLHRRRISNIPDNEEELDPLEDWDSLPGEFELRLESITDLDLDFTRSIRQPAPGDLWLEERIKEHLAPLLKPDEPVKCAPPYDESQETQWSPECRQARQAVVDRAKAIQLARSLRLQGKLWESVRQYQKVNQASGYSTATLLEEMDALSEAHLGTLRDVDMNWPFDFYNMTTLAIDSFCELSLFYWGTGSRERRSWDRTLDILSGFRPATEPLHSLFTSCLSCLVALDNILLYLSFDAHLPQEHRLQLGGRARSCSVSACVLIWHESDRLPLRSKLFMRRRVILSFRRCQPRCDVSVEVVSACFNIGLDLVQLLVQDLETLSLLQHRLSCLGEMIRPHYMQELAVIRGLRTSQGEHALCSTLEALARYLDDMRATENTQAVEHLISALLLYGSSITATIHRRLRELFWSWNNSPWYGYDVTVDFIGFHPLVIRIAAEIPRVPDTWNQHGGPYAPRTPSLGSDLGSSTMAGMGGFGTRSLFTTGAGEKSFAQHVRYNWLLTAWSLDEIEHSLLALNLVEHHYLFSRRQHVRRHLSSVVPFGPLLYFGPSTEVAMRGCRYACVRDRALPTELADRIRALQAEKQMIGLLLCDIGAILRSNAALPQKLRLPSCGMEIINIDVLLDAADSQAELASIVSGEARVLAFAIARQEYISALAVARQAFPSGIAQSHRQETRLFHLRRILSSACKHGELGLLRVERELLRMGSLIGGTPGIRVTCLRVERTLREELYSHLQDFLVSGGTYEHLCHLQDLPQYTDFSTVYATGREAALIAGDPVEALWWQQNGKAEMTSAYIVDRRIRAELISWSRRGYRQALPWASVVERVERLGRQIQAMLPNQRGDRSRTLDISDIISRRRLDSSDLRAIFPMSDRPLATEPQETAARRIVWLDWVEDSEGELYHLTFARFGETPIHLRIFEITPSNLRHWIGQSLRRSSTLWTAPDGISRLRDLDDLIRPLRTLLLPEDELVICPTGLLHAIPLHALHIAAGVPLLQLYPVLYATSLAAYLSCVSRSESRSNDKSEAAIAAIYRPQPDQVVSPDFDHIQTELHDILRALSAQTGTRFLWDAEVTPKSFTDLLRTHRAVLFCGHCSSAPDNDSGETDTDPRLILHTDNLKTSDLFDCNLPSSLLVLIACGSSAQTMGVLDEPMGLPTAALVAGAATVVGTMWPVRLVPAVRFIQRFLYWLGRPETKMDNGMINIAREVQHATLDVRERFPRPADWAGYVLHGSPVMRDMGLGQLEDPSSLIGGT